MSAVVVTDPWAAMRQRIEETGQRTDLPAEERLLLLREYESDLTSLLGLVGKFRGDAWLEQEAREPTMQEAVAQLREEAAVRSQLVESERASAAELDALGILSEADIELLDEEGLLEAWVLQEWKNVVYDPLKHPRGTGGHWIDVLGRAIKPKGRKGKGVTTAKPPKEPKPVKPVDPDKAVADASKVGTAAVKAESAARTASRPPTEGGPKNEDDWVDVGDDVEAAARLLGQGQKVRLNQPHQVSTLLDKLHSISKEMIEKGEKAPNFDLCKVSVKGTNLFCAQSKGIPRAQMPQLEGNAEAGSKGDTLPKDKKGRVNLSDQFRAHLESLGVKTEDVDEKASFLRASQHELNGAIVARIATELRDEGRKMKRLFVSKDNYIIDGHHNWAATIGLDTSDGTLGDLDMPITRIDMPIMDVLDEANKFASAWGISQQGFDPAVQKNIDQIDEAGLNEWPKPGPDAQRILQGAKDTEELHTIPSKGTAGAGPLYTEERQQLHDRIVDTLLRKRMEVPDGKGGTELHPHPGGELLTPDGDAPRILLMAGGTASGKSTALALNPDAIPPSAVHVDPDEIKAMLPEYNMMLKAGERYAASAVHEESSHIAKRLHAEATAKNLNIVLDGTGDSKAGKFSGKIKEAKGAGYSPEVFYVNAPTDVAIARAIDRAKKTGRWVPVPEIRSQHKNVSARFNEDVRPLIEDGTVDRFQMYQTDKEPILIADGGKGAFTVHDQGLFSDFQAKENEPTGS